MNKKVKRYADKGFTLVELIIVIAIMAVLASAIGLSVIRYIEKSRQALDIHNGSMIKNALTIYPFPSNFQGTDVYYTDPVTGESEHFRRGWVYVDKDEIRCSDPSCALAMIDGGLVSVSDYTYQQIRKCEEDGNLWFPPGGDGDFYRRSAINEYVFKNDLTVKARRTWNTYQLDVYLDDNDEVHLGASASNTTRVGGHEKDEETAKLFAEKMGFHDAKITPIGEQNSD
jgi:prepilin-type N-terminal cleavage/methylation domain-containing protein